MRIALQIKAMEEGIWSIKRREWQACVRRCQRLAFSAGTVL